MWLPGFRQFSRSRDHYLIFPLMKLSLLVPLLCVLLPASSATAPAANLLSTVNSTLHLAYSAFCPQEDLKTWSCIWCQPDTTPAVELVQYLSNDKFGTQGYVGIDETSKRIIVAFRGSYNIPNDIEDALFFLSPFDKEPTVKVEHGFQVAYNSVREDMLAGVKSAREACPDCSITFTGHSLGAAMSTLAAAEVAASVTASTTLTTELFTFGCPRVGDSAFVNWSHELITSTTRVARERDIVPHIPPSIHEGPAFLTGYTHPPREIWNRHQEKAEWLVECDPVNGEDPACSNSQVNYSPAEHTEYLGFHGGYC